MPNMTPPRDYDSIIKSYMLEQDIYLRVLATLSPEEHKALEAHPRTILRSNGSMLRYMPDIYLPEGCKKMGFEGATCIDVKNRLIPGIVLRFKRLFSELNEDSDNKIKNFVIVYQESNVEESYLKEASDKGFYVLSVSELESRGLEKRKKEETPVNEENEKNLISKAKTAFSNGDVVLFLGAGVSMSAGLPSWDNLLKKILKKGTSIPESDFEHISEQCFDSLIITARYIKSLYKKKRKGKEDIDAEFKEILRKELYRSRPDIANGKVEQYKLINTIGELISKKQVESIITYNYDNLMEQELERRKIKYTSVSGSNRWLKGDVPIYHVHGLLPYDKKELLDSNIILSEEEYHNAYKESFNWATVEQLHALRYKSCFFIGLSMSDPNLRRLLDLASDGSDKEPHHFVFLQDRTDSLFYSGENAEIIQSMMHGFGLNVIWYKEHDELPEILKQIYTE